MGVSTGQRSEIRGFALRIARRAIASSGVAGARTGVERDIMKMTKATIARRLAELDAQRDAATGRRLEQVLTAVGSHGLPGVNGGTVYAVSYRPVRTLAEKNERRELLVEWNRR